MKNKKIICPLEKEVDQWRDKVIEKYENVSENERTKKINENAKILAKQYGFKICKY